MSRGHMSNQRFTRNQAPNRGVTPSFCDVLKDLSLNDDGELPLLPHSDPSSDPKNWAVEVNNGWARPPLPRSNGTKPYISEFDG